MFTYFATGCTANCDYAHMQNVALSRHVHRTYKWHSTNLLRLQAEDEMTNITQVMAWQTLCTVYRGNLHLNTPANALPVNTLHSRLKKKVKWFRYRPGVAQRVGKGIAPFFHDRGTRRGWVVSSMPWPHFTPGKDPVPILQEAGWAPGPVWTGRKSRPHRDSIQDRPASSQSLYRLSYAAHTSQ